jgi:ATP-dependent Clp protease ATP-binding subunit ClpB
MTSNAGSQFLVDPKLNVHDREEKARDVLKSLFRPEFLNRIDEIVVFKSLEEAQIRQIVAVQLRQLESRLSEKKIKLRFNDKVLSALAHKGFDPIYGARPLKRAVQTEVMNPLAREIISHTIQAGDTVELTADDLHVRISKAAP